MELSRVDGFTGGGGGAGVANALTPKRETLSEKLHECSKHVYEIDSLSRQIENGFGLGRPEVDPGGSAEQQPTDLSMHLDLLREKLRIIQSRLSTVAGAI